jgi:signal peptide peptidase SppA
MRSLIRDIKGNRPLLISPVIAKDYLERAASLDISMDAKLSGMTEMIEAMFGKVAVLEKFPPYAIVPIKGVIGSGLSELERMCGCCDLHAVEEMLEEAERDPSIKTIILDVDSPGGTSVGVPELANRIRASKKQTIAFTANEACSAAYWLASQASEFYATPSSSVGSIGCYIAYNDMSQAYANEGIKVEVLKAGRYKAAGVPGTSLNEDQRAMLQEEVIEIWEDFKAAVLSVREFASPEALDAKIYSGKKAAENGLVTGLVNGFDELMEALDAQVAAQMEADEENDARHEEAEEVAQGEEGEEDEEQAGYTRMASGRALGKDVLKALSASKAKAPKVKAEEDDEEEGEEGEGEMKAEEAPEDGEDEKGEPAQPAASEDDEGEEDVDAKSSEDDDEDDKADEAIEEEADAGEKAVDTDKKHDRKDGKRFKSKGVA